MVNNQIEITVKITGIICFWGLFVFRLNPLMGALKPQSNRPLYSNTVIGTLIVDGYSEEGPGRDGAPPSPSSLYQM